MTPQNVLDALATLDAYFKTAPAPPPKSTQTPEFLIQFGYVRLYMVGTAIAYISGMQINGDGAPKCYNPVSSKGLDALSNAGHPGNWWGIATSNGKSSGQAVIQGPSDPAPGFYVSTTALQVPGEPDTSQKAYVDASTVPFIVLPGKIGMGLRLGDLCFCLNTATNDNDFGIYADIGPSHQIGEASIAMADALKVPSSPRTGGVSGGILTLVFPGSGSGYQTKEQWFPKADAAFQAWGGLTGAHALISKIE